MPSSRTGSAGSLRSSAGNWTMREGTRGSRARSSCSEGHRPTRVAPRDAGRHEFLAGPPVATSCSQETGGDELLAGMTGRHEFLQDHGRRELLGGAAGEREAGGGTRRGGRVAAPRRAVTAGRADSNGASYGGRGESARRYGDRL